jgi:hypothetical protein
MKFLERAGAATTLDRPGDTLRQQKSPGDDVPVPGIDDHVNVLAEEVAVAVDESEVRGWLCARQRCLE